MKRVLSLVACLVCSIILTACQENKLLEEKLFLAKLDSIRGDYTYEEIQDMDSDKYYCVEKTCGTLDFLIFKDAESFLEAFGFAKEAPFYEIYVEEELKLTLYYDEETQLGCGDDGSGWGFCFLGCTQTEWNGFPRGDYMELVSAYGERPEDYMGDVAYDEITEYDAQGRLTEYRVTGAVELLEAELGDAGGTDDVALRITYRYHTNGEVAYRAYFHNPFILGTTSSSIKTWFDEQGRPVYEQAYITHGSLNWYYIYEDDDKTPEYILYMDHNGGNAEFSTTITPDSKQDK
ncbi:MAG: hypothetical protein IJZ82_02910 [Lachnospiraceae bacterium]|nr:hypothetical protein [Lachnospiraceae bacterium]